MEELIILYIIISGMVFFIYGVDKIKAQRGSYRIPEKTLLISGMIGPLGALLGMYGFRHKTKKIRFKVLNGLFFIIHVATILYLYIYII